MHSTSPTIDSCLPGGGAVPLQAPQAARALRAAGLKVTSARVATLRAAPVVLERHGCLNPPLLHEACRQLGYSMHLSVFYQLLPTLAGAGLIPVHALRLPPSRMAGLSVVSNEGAHPDVSIETHRVEVDESAD